VGTLKTSEQLLADVEEELLAAQLEGSSDADQDVPIHSSPRDLRDIEKSTAWKDIKRRLLASLVSRRDQMEVLGENAGHPLAILSQLGNLQGEAFQIRTFLEMPERLAQQKEMELKDGEEEVRRDAAGRAAESR